MEGLKKALYIILASIVFCCAVLALFLFRDSISATFANVFEQLSALTSSSSSGGNSSRSRNNSGGRGGERGRDRDGTAVDPAAQDLPAFPYPELLETLDRASNQFVVVLGRGSYGNLWLVERQNDGYLFTAGPLYCRLGREGLTDDKTDGDWRTPTGSYPIGRLYGADSASYQIKLDYTQISQGDVWVDDIYSVHYNRFYRAQEGQSADFVSYKTLSRTQGSLYLDIGYNSNCVPGRGAGVLLSAVSNISVPTDGDISLLYADLLRIVQWLDPAEQPLMVIQQADLVEWELEGTLMPGYHALSESVSTVLENPVYATGQNWSGEVLPGYYGYQVMVSNALGEALRLAATAARVEHVNLLVLDGYRPQRANLRIEQLLTERYGSPDPEDEDAPLTLPAQLAAQIAQGYQHSYGLAVDLTLVDSSSGEPLDMGGPYDPTAETAAYGSPYLTEEQQANRQLLRQIMEQSGFVGNSTAWWHFELAEASHLSAYYDFAIPQ